MLKNKLLLAIVAVICSTVINAQTVVIDNAKFDPGVGNSYSAGGSVAIPLNNSGCFAINNKFKWELMDATGVNFINATGGIAATPASRVADSVAVFYATFINTFLPSTLPTGIYTIKVSATTFGSTAATTIPFAVTNGSAITAAAAPTDTFKILKPEYYYGICDGASVLGFDLNNNSTGTNSILQLHDDYHNVQMPNVSPVAGKFNLQFTPVQVGTKFRDAYYTAIVKTDNGAGVISTKAYHIINSNWDISAQISDKSFGQRYSCSGDTVKLYVQIKSGNDQQLQQNFPGATISIEWNSGGSSNPVDLYTPCQIIAANGYISHYYKDGACIGAGNTSYKTKATVNNPFNIINGPGLTGTCAAGAADQSQAYIFTKPKASFKCDSVICLNDTLKLINISNPGQGPAAQSGLNVCANLGQYRWDVFNNAVPLYVSSKSETPKDTAYVFTSLADTGYHNIKLTINNNYNAQSPCPAHDTTARVCVDNPNNPIIPSYQLDSAALGTNIKNDSIIGCAPIIKMLNGTRRTFCLDSTQFKYIWQVYDASKPYVAKDSLPVGTIYTFGVGSNARSMSPTISFNKTGKYWISLRVKGKCDTTAAVLKYIEANGDAGVSMEYDSVFNCFSPVGFTINYDSAAVNSSLYANIAGVNTPITKNRVKYTYQASAAGSLNFKWTVQPGSSPTDWDFVGGTTSTSQFPQIQFKKKGIYTVVDTFKNNCATKYATQIVDFEAGPSTGTTSAAVDTICHSVQSFRIYGFTVDTSINKNLQVTWSCVEDTNGTFVFDAGYNGDLSVDTLHNLHPTFFPSPSAYNRSCASGKKFTIQMRVASKTNKACPPSFNFRYLWILPCIPSNDVTVNLCSNNRLNYVIPSPPGTLFKYDRIDANTTSVNGSTAGSGGAYVNAITDSLILIPPGPGVVQYQITPKSGTCDGDPYKLTVNVQPIPNVPTVTMSYPNNAPIYSLCSGEQVQIDLSTINPTDKFTWKSFTAIGNATGNTQQATPKQSPINDLLQNSKQPFANDTVTYIIKTVSQYACKGDSVIQKVIVTPGPPKAKIVGSNTGSRLVYCDSLCVNFKGNSPTAIGDGIWTLKSASSGAPTPTFTNTSDSTVQICGLIPNKDYWFYYTVAPKLTGCRSSIDSIEVYIVDTVSIPSGLRDTIFCDVKGSQYQGFQMCANLSRPLPPSESYNWFIRSSTTPVTQASPVTTQTPCTQIVFKDPEIDTVIIQAWNGICPSKYDTAIVRLYKKPLGNNSITLAPAQSNDRYCQGSNITVTATLNAKEDDMYYWYYEDFPNYINRVDSITNKNPFVINNLQDSIVITGVVRSKGWNYGCLDTAVTTHKIVYVDSPTVKGILVSNDTIVCKPGDRALIELKNYRGESITWILSTTDSVNNFVNAGAPFGSTTITPPILSTTWYKAIVQNGNCSPDTTAAIRIYIPTNSGNAVIYNNDTAICGDSTIKLTGNTPLAGVGYWSAINGYNNPPIPGAVNFYPASFDTAVNPVIANISTYGIYKFVWTIKNFTCPGTRDTVIVINTEPIANNTINPTVDTVCKGTPVSFTGSVATGGGYIPNTTTSNIQYVWERQILGSSKWDTVGYNQNSYLFPGDTSSLIRRTLKSDSCVSYSNVTQVIVQTRIANNIITPAVTPICTGNPATINGQTPTGAAGTYVYEWYYGTSQDTTNHNLTNAANTGLSYTTPFNLTTTLHFQRIVSSGKCTDTSAYATVTVNPDAVANFTASQYTACPVFNIDQFVVNTTKPNTTYDWYATYHGVRTFIGSSTTSTMPAYALTTGPDSVMITVVATSTQGCKPDSMSRMFYTSAKPVASFTVSVDSGCASSTTNATNFKFNNTTINQSLFTYQWILNGGNGNPSTATLAPAGYQYPGSTTGLDTSYIISLQAISPTCGVSVYSDTIKVRTTPHVRFSAAPTFQCSDSLVKFTNATVGSNLTYAWYFGDNGNTVGATNSDTVSHAYHDTVLTTHYPKLVASNECSSDSSQIPVVVTSNTGTITLNISVKGAPYQCTPATYTFYTNSTGATTYIWNFGDGSSSVPSTNGNDSVTHTYTKAGTYYVTLTGTTACGSVSKMDSVFVFGTPKVNFTIAPNTTVCKGDTIRFTNLTDTATFYNWKFGDGLTSGAINPTKTYTTSGSYDVKLIATRQHNLPLGGSMSCTDSSSVQTITVKDSMPASFTITPLGASCLPYNVQFANTTTITTVPYNTNWNFGSSITPQTGNTVTQSFTALGQYNVIMTALNAAGCTYVDSQKVTVAGPTGTWTHDTGYICGATPVKFNVYGNSYTDSIIVDYGDSIVSMLYTGSGVFTHVYATGGTYYPSVTLKSTNGCTFFLNSYGAVRVDYVKAAYTIIKTNNCGNTVVLFKNNSTMDQTPALQTTNWWIDGSSPVGHSYDTTATFNATNTHTVKLQTISVSGCQDSVATVVIDVKVNNIPQILSITRQDTACVNQTIYYVANVAPSEDPIVSYTWGFANGTQFSSGTPNASTVYGVAGNGYFDTVTVATAYCSAKLVSNRLVINPTPSVSINPSQDTSICLGNSITLTASGAGTNNYVWGPNFGLNTTTGAVVIATPTDTVKYFVTGTNIYGCSDSASINIGVVQPYTITIAATPNDTLCLGETATLRAITNSVLQPSFTWTPSAGLDTTRGAIVHATPKTTTIYTVYGNNSAGCFPSTSDSILIAVGDTLHVAFGIDTVRLQGGIQYHLNPFYSDATASTIWTPATNLDNAFLANPTATVLDNVCYQVAATSIYGCKDTAQICIQAFCEASQVFIPNTFTPDGNGLNDYFYVTATGIQKVTSFRVFNRWGQVMFERAGFVPPPYQSATFNPATAWDGKFKGVIAPTDTYVYTCEVMCANGTKFVYTGSVTLIK